MTAEDTKNIIDQLIKQVESLTGETKIQSMEKILAYLPLQIGAEKKLSCPICKNTEDMRTVQTHIWFGTDKGFVCQGCGRKTIAD
jgi:hypothetical protein